MLIGYVSDERYLALHDVSLEFLRDGDSVARVRSSPRGAVVAELPPGDYTVELARDDTQPFQAFRIGDRPMYGTQFHSELDAARERERLICYRANYPEIETEEEFQQVLADLRETTEVDNLLHEFLVRIVVPYWR